VLFHNKVVKLWIKLHKKYEIFYTILIYFLCGTMKSWTHDTIDRLKTIIDSLSAEDGKFICRVIYRDPLKNIYSILLIIYAFILGISLLWPFDFVSIVRNDARWIDNSKGIEFLEIGQAVSNASTQEFFDRLVKGSGLTLEVWLKTEDLSQSGPARILSYSINQVLRNFTIGQSKDQLVVRLRTIETSLNGMNPHLIVNDVFNDKGLKHIVIIYNFLEQRVYINGEQKVRSKILKGNFSNWDPSCRLVLGNEVTGDRPWKGKIYNVAIYDRPLTKKEIRQNYLSGLRSKVNKGDTKDVDIKAKGLVARFLFYLSELHSKVNNWGMKRADAKAKSLVARYLFNEGKGDVIHDSGSVLNPMNLYMPIKLKVKPFLSFSIDSLDSKSQFSDIIINILIFIPLGIFIHGMLRNRFGLTLKISILGLLVGTLFTLGVESIQHFSMTRDSSLIDVFTNTTGIVIGIMIDRVYTMFLNDQAERLRKLLYDRIE
jgi:VanZ family protein